MGFRRPELLERLGRAEKNSVRRRLTIKIAAGVAKDVRVLRGTMEQTQRR
jgi:hypothetical protein